MSGVLKSYLFVRNYLLMICLCYLIYVLLFLLFLHCLQLVTPAALHIFLHVLRGKLKVNNNPIKQYTTANCSYLPQINGANLGVVNQLSIENAVTLSWQSCVNNVLNGKLYYRVYRENTTTPGAFSELPLTILTTNVSGAYTNKQFSLAAGASVDLLNGLLPDQEYKLELYLKNEVDLNQDNISDSLLIENNVGNNFKASFRTKPSAGPVMVSFPQKSMVTCPGEPMVKQQLLQPEALRHIPICGAMATKLLRSPMLPPALILSQLLAHRGGKAVVVLP